MSPTVVACTPRFWTLLFNQYQQEVLLATAQAREQHRKRAGTEDATETTSNASGKESNSPLLEDNVFENRGDDDKKSKETKSTSGEDPSHDDDAMKKGLLRQVAAPPPEHRQLAIGLQRQVSVQSEAERALLEDQQWEPDVNAIRSEVMKRFKGILGNRASILVTGGASTSKAVLKFMESCFCAMVSDGYGATEVRGGMLWKGSG